MTTADVKRLYCECYAVVIMAIKRAGDAKIAEMLSAIPGGLFCATGTCWKGHADFVLNEVKVTADVADSYDVCIKIGKGTMQSRDASDFVDMLCEYGTYPANEEMCTVEYIKTWRTLLSAMPFTANARLVVDRIDAFLKKAE